MESILFLSVIHRFQPQIELIKLSAHQLHQSVNQTYDEIHPYGYHLDMVVEIIQKYGHAVCASEEDVLPLLFGGYYHDSIEDARLTYNDVFTEAKKYMNEPQALMATEIVYALTNDKGRTRSERAGEKYYQGIRETPYAPFVKMADRFANIYYSFSHTNQSNQHMKEVYKKEWPHFLESVSVKNDDIRFHIPHELIDSMKIMIDK